MKYVVEFRDFERYVTETEQDQIDCIKYLLNKYKKDFPDDMVHTFTAPDTFETTWPKKDKKV